MSSFNEFIYLLNVLLNHIINIELNNWHSELINDVRENRTSGSTPYV